jgi:signal transduction histidine kinase
MKTILLIDDDEQIRISFSAALRQKNYRVLVANSGTEGLAVALQHLPDLILTDINMPGGNGEALLRQIRQNPELAHKQVVMMTGRPDLVTPRGGMEAGADDFLVKPVTLEALFRCMEVRLNRAEIHWRLEDRMLATLRTSLHAGLPHEFFTPLAGIIGLSEILLDDNGTIPAEERRTLLNDIHVSALRLHRTLRNYLLILSFQDESKKSTGPVPTSSRRDWDDAVRAGAAASCRHHGRVDDLNISQVGAPAPIRPGDLSLIVEELVDNACKFSRHQTPIELRYDSDQNLTVTDQGRGMTPAEIGQIGLFKQFDRKKFEHQGLGLGLVLVQKLAAQYGANLSIESEPGKGTCARISFGPSPTAVQSTPA